MFTPTVTAENTDWYRGTADAIHQNLDFLKKRHEPYVVISSGDCVYKMDYNDMIEYHIEKGADITIACKDMPEGTDCSRYGVVKMNEEYRIVDFEEKPIVANSNTISAGVYVVRRRLLIELLEECANENRYDLVNDVFIRHKGVKQIFGYKIQNYWSNIAEVKDYYKTNMDFLKPEVRQYFKNEPKIYSKVNDLPPAKYNEGSEVKNSLVACGCIINGKVENSILYRKAFVGKNCVIKNSIILNDVYIGDNARIENCIVESNGTIKENTYYYGEEEPRIVLEKNERYIM